MVIGLALLLMGCNKTAKTLAASNEPTEISDLKPSNFDVVNNIEGITMNIKKDMVSPTGLTVILENTTEEQCIYGKPYILEKKVNGNWYQVPVIKDNYGFEDIAYILAPKSSAEVTIDWEWLYGSLKPGEYRIIKDISIDSEEYNPRYLSAEFIIE